MSASDSRVPLPGRLEAASVRMGIVSLSLVGIGLVFACVAPPSHLNEQILAYICLGAVLFGLAAIAVSIHLEVLVSRKRKILPPDQLVFRKKFPVGPFLGGLGLLLAFYVFHAAAVKLSPRPHPKNSCINNLRQLEGAKEQWATETKKTATDRPFWDDLVGENKYLKTMPVCPDPTGTYMLGNVGTPVRCTVPGHTLR